MNHNTALLLKDFILTIPMPVCHCILKEQEHLMGCKHAEMKYARDELIRAIGADETIIR